MPPKRRPNPKSTPLKPTTTTLTPNNTSPPIPPPFTPAPPTLNPFLSTLSNNHIYILSQDTHPIPQKRLIYLIPLLLNLTLTTLLLLRLYHALPTYTSIFLAALGHETRMSLQVKNVDAYTKLGIGGERALMFLGDFLLVRFVGLWPLGFFWGLGGEVGPVGWRAGVGWREVEVAVRRSRRWDRALFTDVDKGDGDEVVKGGVKEGWLEEGREGVVWRERVEPAVRREWVRGKTSYLMMDKSWDLFSGGMVRAHRLVDEGEVDIEEFRTRVLLFSERFGWLSWDVWREHGEGGGDGEGDEGTRKLQLVKDKLTKMGKENLFFRWIEVVQSETSQPGEFTVEKQKKAVRKIREEFEEKGVDFDGFWADVDGGIESMPGLEITG